MHLHTLWPLRAGYSAIGATCTAVLFLLAYLLPEQHEFAILTLRDGLVENGFHPIVEVEGIAIGRPFTAPEDFSKDFDSVPWLIETLKARFASSAAQNGLRPPEYATCSLDPARYEGTLFSQPGGYLLSSRARRDSVVSIAIDLRDSGEVIPTQAVALLTAVAHLLTYNRVYVSIFENGSEDNTRELLSDLAAALEAMGVDGLWVYTSQMTSKLDLGNRIMMLSEFRNLALAPLISHARSARGATTLIFLNDVVTCASDLLELVHQQRLQKADMVMGMDWGVVDRESGKQPKARLYDMWVARGINGELCYPFEHNAGYSPLAESGNWVTDAFSTQSEDVRRRWRHGLPLPVYSGWGGMAAFDATLFTKEHLRFRSSIRSGWTGGSSTGALGDWGRLIGTSGYLESDCPGASECEYICRDIWNLRHGKARILLVPQVRTSYTVEEWEIVKDQVPAMERNETDSAVEDLVDWTNVRIPEQVACVGTRTFEGEPIETWGENNERTRLDPLFSHRNSTNEPRRA